MAVVLMISLMASGFAWAQRGRGFGQEPGAAAPSMRMDPVARLNRALESAGAPRLSAEQEKEVTTLAENFRATRQQARSDEELTAARKNLEQAILSGNAQAADEAAAALSDRISAHMRDRIRERARLQIQVLSILNDEQVTALKNQYGDSGLIWTLGSVAGHRGMMGHRGWK